MAPYSKMQVWEGNRRGVVQFSSEDLIMRGSVLGVVVEDAPLVSLLWESLRDKLSSSSASISLLAPGVLSDLSPASIDANNGPISFSMTNPVTKSPKQISAQLLVGCNGANFSILKCLAINDSFPTDPPPYFPWDTATKAQCRNTPI